MADIEQATASSPDGQFLRDDISRHSMLQEQVGETALPVVNDSQCEIWVPDEKRLELSSEVPGATEDNLLPKETGQTSESEPEKSWSELSCVGRTRRVASWILRPIAVILLLYFFVCSLNLLSSAFRLVGGKAAGNAFSSNVLVQNPIAGLMIGILATVLVQSSSTSTSIVVAMVSSGILEVRPAIPIIMGANIGTSVTNTIVSLAQSGDRAQFERAFAGATVHDMFNWLAVIVLLPLEVATGCLYHLTHVLVTRTNFTTSVEGANRDILKAITKPLTMSIVQLDKKVIENLALGHEEYQNKSLLKQWCGYREVLTPFNTTDLVSMEPNATVAEPDVFINGTGFLISKEPTVECWYLLKMIPLSDLFVGLILMAASLTVLCTCLVLIVKILNSALKGPIAKVTHKIINKDLPGRCAYFTGYLAILAGAGMTIIVQSSSVFTSTLTPLVGMNIVSLERMYPLTLGSNIGTTTTGLLAAMAASSSKRQAALQIALVHLFFNIAAILIYYPVPAMRFPLPMARMMGRTTGQYRWFAVAYLVAMFFMLPGSLFALSVAGPIPFAVVGSVALAFILFLLMINSMKKKYYSRLTPCLTKFVDAMPRAFYTLKPLDDGFRSVFRGIKHIFRCYCCRKPREPKVMIVEPLNQSLESNGLRPNDSFFDTMTEDQIREYECTVRSLEEVKAMLSDPEPHKTDIVEVTESGYVTMLPTPYLSKYPSREDNSYV